MKNPNGYSIEDIEVMKEIKEEQNFPKYLFRRDDGERFSHIGAGLYWMDNSMMPKDFKEYQYSYELLVKNGFKTKLKDCSISKYINSNDGHGNGDYDE